MTIRINSFGQNIKQCAAIITVIAKKTLGYHPETEIATNEADHLSMSPTARLAHPGLILITNAVIETGNATENETEIVIENGTVIVTTEDKTKDAQMTGKDSRIEEAIAEVIESAVDHATTAEAPVDREIHLTAEMTRYAMGKETAKGTTLSANKIEKVRTH